MRHTDFVHLHTHTEYSLLDGMTRIPDMIEKAKNNHMPALAITDHGNLFAAINFYMACERAGIKPVIGCELYVAPGDRREKAAHGISEAAFHLTVLVRDEEGYKNLMKMVSLGYIEGFYYRPRVDKEILERFKNGLIVLSGCLKGEVSHLLLSDEIEQAEQVIGFYKEIMGKGNYYLEIMSQGLEGQKKVNREIIKLSRKLGVPIVATNDCHYLERRDSEAHEVLLCIQTGSNLDDPKHLKFATDEFYFKSGQEMYKIFQEIPQALNNTIRIAEECNLEIKFGQSHLPKYKVPDKTTPDAFLDKLCRDGIKYRNLEKSKDVEARLQHELSMIKSMGYASYFLTVWDFVQYARKNGIPVGPGRGSAAGSLVAYLLGITDINPLKYNLLFERFLNPERITLPDIDIDFCYERRGEVIKYVTEKYGAENVAQIITFGTMAARGVIRDVGRALRIPYSEVDRIAKLIPQELDMTLGKALEREPELRDLAEGDDRISKLIKISLSLEGLARHASTHAAGVVISEKPLTEYIPLFKGTNEEITTQYDMNTLEKIGLLKMDFLGLKTLTVIEETRGIIKRLNGREIDLGNIPLNDKKTFAMLNKAETMGVFQLESSGMRDLTRKIGLEKFEDLIALIALFRPGPMNMLEDYVRRKHGKVPIRYDHPLLEPILKDTYGVMLYQEQVMHILHEIGGFSLSKADSFRRAISKKIPEIMDRQRQAFIEGAQSRNINKRIANKIFNQIVKFAGYGFNKSHSAAYALIAYQTAYLKAHYPVAFMASLLTSEMANTDKIVVYINECKRMGINVLPPDVNESFAKFTVVGDEIRFGLAAVKNVGTQAINSITETRLKEGPFKSLHDFCEKVDLRVVNRRVVESLIKCGAFDSLGVRRSQLMAVIDHALEMAQLNQADKEKGQISFLPIFESEEKFRADLEELPDIPEWPENTLLAYEKEMLGFYVTGHPLAGFSEEIHTYASASTTDLPNMKDGEEVNLGGIIVAIKRIVTKKGERMAFVSFEDLEGMCEVIVFPGVFEKVKGILKIDNLIFVKGRLDLRGEKPKVISVDIFPLAEVKEKMTREIHVTVRLPGLEEEMLLRLKKIFLSHQGDCPIFLHLIDSDKKEIVVAAGRNIRSRANPELLRQIEGLLGENAVSFTS